MHQCSRIDRLAGLPLSRDGWAISCSESQYYHLQELPAVTPDSKAAYDRNTLCCRPPGPNEHCANLLHATQTYACV